MNIKSIIWYGICLLFFFFKWKQLYKLQILSHFFTKDRWSEGHLIRLEDKKAQLLQSWFWWLYDIVGY